MTSYHIIALDRRLACRDGRSFFLCGVSVGASYSFWGLESKRSKRNGNGESLKTILVPPCINGMRLLLVQVLGLYFAIAIPGLQPCRSSERCLQIFPGARCFRTVAR